MTNPEEEQKRISGLIKKKPFNINPEVRKPMVNPVVGYSLQEFFENTARVVRVPNLSSPLEYFGSDKKEVLCLKAYRHVTAVLLRCPDLMNVPFTIIDGTAWDKAVGSTKYSPDISHINVFWQNDKPIVSVALGMRMIMKTYTLYHLEKENRVYVMFEHDARLTDAEIYNHVRKAIEDSTRNSFLFSEYGGAIAKGLTTVFGVLLEYPVAAATYLNDEIWYADRLVRHHHIVQSEEYLEAKERHIPEEKQQLQGFLTNHGNFITRYRASYLAASNSMILDSAGLNMPLVDSRDRPHREIMQYMGGIIQMGDLGRKDYRIGAYPLFSEDLW
jgi:hypothetical protein